MAGRLLFFFATTAAAILSTIAVFQFQLLVSPCSALSATTTPRRGFGAEKPQQPPPSPRSKKTPINDAAAEQTARSLFGVCSHLQNPELYVPSWADACAVRENESENDSTGVLVASRAIVRGDIISLYPIHSLGLRGSNSNKKSNKKKPVKKKNNRKSKQQQQGGGRTSDYLVYDADRDGAFFGSNRRTTNYCIDFPAMTDRPELRGQSLFLDANPDRELVPGWLGHKCGRSSSSLSSSSASNSNSDSNCAAIPIEGAVPLIMVVATRDIPEGDELIRDVATNQGEALIKDRITQSGKLAMERYADQISELKGFTDMVYQQQQQHQQQNSQGGTAAPQTDATATDEVDDKDNDDDNSETKTDPSANKCTFKFKPINLEYPGLVEFHADPDVYAVDQFLTADECDRIVAKCEPHTAPCVVVTPDGETVESDDRRRTSTEALLPMAEAPTVVAKLTELLECSGDQLEILQVLRYRAGQEFKAHTDGFDGPVTASGFRNSGRLATVFVYLNDVKKGGHTEFPELGFTVAPKKGSAIVHFPATLGLREDTRTLHRGMPAIDEKWLLATWVWQHERTDEDYAESRLPTLSDDVI